MRIKNNSTYPKVIRGTRLEPGRTEEVSGVKKSELPYNVEVVEQSGSSGSDQKNYSDNESESENLENEDEKGGE